MHGEETPEEVAAVRRAVAAGLPGLEGASRRRSAAGPRADRRDLVLLDARTGRGAGGTGTSFDWDLLDRLPRPRRLGLAGGLDADNVWRAASMGPRCST
ncbi:MAG: hypothetical protein R2909_20675 [Gemmatimonadales bacterium]